MPTTMHGPICRAVRAADTSSLVPAALAARRAGALIRHAQVGRDDGRAADAARS
jgi:hypothetical protein